jgi:hypothetical protein
MDIMNTSDIASQSIAHIRYRLQKEVYDYLKTNGPSIHQTMEIHFSDRYGPSTVRARCRELVKQGWVKDTGKLGRTKAKRPAIIWRAI